MLSKSSIPTEVEEFLQLNFIVDLTPLVFMPHMKKLIFSSPDMMAQATEGSKLENSKLHSLLNLTLMLETMFPEDHLTIPQDHSEEMIASNQELLNHSKAIGEL